MPIRPLGRPHLVAHPLNPFFSSRATTFAPGEDFVGYNGGTDVVALKSGKYVYMSGFQMSPTLLVGSTTLLQQSGRRAFLAQVDAKTGTPVAASNQLVPGSPAASAITRLSMDGKVRRLFV